MNDTPSPLESAGEPLPPRPATVSTWRNPWLYVALAAIGLAGWQWIETRARLVDTQQEVARRLSEAAAAGREDRGALKQAQEQVAALQAKVGALEAKQAEFQGQAEELQTLFQDLARTRDDALLLEVEQAVALAAQQLQLAGNVPAAVLALETADARLAGLDRPQLIPLRKTLARDLERLRALPFVDVAGMSVKLENIILGIDKFPLAAEERPRVAAPAAGAAEPPADGAEGASVRPWWQSAAADFWQEIKGLVRIQRFDRAEPVLLAPGQAFFLRENLKLRLLNARLALLARDAWTFRNEVRAAQEWLSRHFDANHRAVQAALASLRQLATAEITIELPNLNDSVAAVRSAKSARDKK